MQKIKMKERKKEMREYMLKTKTKLTIKPQNASSNHTVEVLKFYSLTDMYYGTKEMSIYET